MNKVRIEVFYQDNALQSIRINHNEMEGLVAIENKTIPEWFMPASGRASWKGLKEELIEQTPGKNENTEYDFIFNGQAEKKALFDYCIQEYGLGKVMGEVTEKADREKTAEEYLRIAERCRQNGENEGVVRACEIAIKEYDAADAKKLLADCYMTGCGVRKDEAKAAEWYNKAAYQGNVRAKYALACAFRNGAGVLPNENQADKWLQEAAAEGCADAQFELAKQYRHECLAERGTGEDRKEAARWFYAAAKQGHADAQWFYARCCEKGWGIEKNEAEAFEWYQKAAENECCPAKYSLGVCYQYGIGISKNISRAVKLYTEAAEQGERFARNDLAVCYAKGIGVEKNTKRAVELFVKEPEKEPKRWNSPYWRPLEQNAIYWIVVYNNWNYCCGNYREEVGRRYMGQGASQKEIVHMVRACEKAVASPMVDLIRTVKMVEKRIKKNGNVDDGILDIPNIRVRDGVLSKRKLLTVGELLIKMS